VTRSDRAVPIGDKVAAERTHGLTDELALINGFIVPSKRERYAGFVGSSKARRKFIRTLYHFSDFDPGTTSSLSDAIDRVFAFVDGTIISCVAGRLAYYEGEAPKNRFILHRKPI
jgi:hypothetical protein